MFQEASRSSNIIWQWRLELHHGGALWNTNKKSSWWNTFDGFKAAGQDNGVRSIAEFRKLDLSCIESKVGRYQVNQVSWSELQRDWPLFDLYSIMVVGDKFSTWRIVSLRENKHTHFTCSNPTHRICSLSFTSPSTLFHTLKISSLCLTLKVAPQISGQSPGGISPPSLRLSRPEWEPFPSPGSSSCLQWSNWSPMMPSTRSSQILSATPFFKRMIHFPPDRLRGSSQTGLRTPLWNIR